jgi:glucose uptake protein GlcU
VCDEDRIHTIFVVALWVPANLLAIYAISLIGISIAQGLWCGFVILVSFLWGALVFRDPVKNWYLTLLGLGMLLLGIVGLATTKITENYSKKQSTSEIIQQGHVEPVEEEIFENDTLPDELDAPADFVQASIINEEENLSYSDTKPSWKQSLSSSKNYIIGVLCCAILGTAGGSMMVPARYSPEKSIVYLVSFGIGNIIVAPVLFVLYFLVRRQRPVFHLTTAAPWGLFSGLLWNLGNFFSTSASLSPLGLTVGYPLTQCALVIGGIVGIVLFKELRKTRSIIQFALSALLLLLPGCALMALFGKA